MEEETAIHEGAEEVFRNGMMVAFNNVLRSSITHEITQTKTLPVDVKTKKFDSLSDLETTFRSRTERACYQGSLFLLNYLVEKNEKSGNRLYDKFIFLSSASGDFKPPADQKPWNSHAVALVRSIHGRWYAGSPANFSVDSADADNPALAVIEGDLPLILSGLKEKFGGNWSTEEQINSVEYIEPAIIQDGELSVTTVRLDKEGQLDFMSYKTLLYDIPVEAVDATL